MDKQNRKAIIAGNWKMNKTATEAKALINELIPAVKDAGCEVVICVPFTDLVIAYEPIWAIGTGKPATADQAEEVCAAIRKVVGELYGEDAAKGLTVQYGGSMNPKNAEELLSKPDVDGGLIGGASLKADQFAVIVDAATKG